MDKEYFQFTTSQGGRHNLPPTFYIIYTFQFTTSQGGRPRPPSVIPPSSSFNSRPHKEVDCFCYVPGRSVRDFQFTTSQGGRQEKEDYESMTAQLSIHDLTRRSTLLLSYKNPPFHLSIHDLTRRSTKILDE